MYLVDLKVCKKLQTFSEIGYRSVYSKTNRDRGSMASMRSSTAAFSSGVDVPHCSEELNHAITNNHVYRVISRNSSNCI